MHLDQFSPSVVQELNFVRITSSQTSFLNFKLTSWTSKKTSENILYKPIYTITEVKTYKSFVLVPLIPISQPQKICLQNKYMLVCYAI